MERGSGIPLPWEREGPARISAWEGEGYIVCPARVSSWEGEGIISA